MMRQCSEVQDNLSAYADGALEEELRALVEAHVSECMVCREEATAQGLVKKHLQTLKRKQDRERVPGRIWVEAKKEWDLRDGRRLRRFQTQFALVMAGVLLMLFGLVWANRAVDDVFPVEAVISDFKALRKDRLKLAFPTSDPDRAIKWLRVKLHDDQLPPIDLSLSGGELAGVDVVPNGSLTFGRLVYRTPQGLVGLYVTPHASRFMHLKPAKLEGETFQVSLDHKNIGFYGWQAGDAGYGLTVSPPLRGAAPLLLDAQRETLQPPH